MKKRVYSIVSFLIITLEIVLCFKGPMALMTTPSLMVAPIYSVGGNQEESEQIFNKVEQLAAKTGSFNVLSKKRLVDYFVNKGEGELGFDYSGNLNYKEYLEISKKLDIERLLLSILSVSRNRVELTVMIRDVESSEIITRKVFRSNSVENILAGVDKDGNKLNIVKELTIGTNGISLFDNIFFFLILCQLLFTILYMKGVYRKGLGEFIISLSLLMYIFAFIYALNANMSYVQLFIAQMGEIGLAESTEKEQLFAFIRFMPFIIINLSLYIGDNIKRRVRIWALPLVILSAFLYSVSFPSFLSLKGFGFLAWIALIPLFYILQTVSKREGVFYGLIFGALQSILINYWHGTFKLIAMPFSTITSVLLYTPFMIVIVFLIRSNRKTNFILIPLIWVVFDYLRSIGFTGYPWGIIGTSQYLTPSFNQLASITGVWGLSFIILLFNSSVVHLILNLKDKGRLIPLYFSVGLILVNIIFGTIYINILDKEAPLDRVKISLIQQNSDPRRHNFYTTYDSLTSLTDRSIEEWGETPDLVVWSEGAFKRDLGFYTKPENSLTAESNGVKKLLEFIKERNVWLLTGTQDHRIEEGINGDEVRKNFNSAALINYRGELEDIYHKIHLVPFSEHFPYKEQFPFIASLLERFNTSNWSVGERRFAFKQEKFQFSTPICFEDVFSSELREFVKNGSDIFVNISNDFWAMTPVEAKQHGVNSLFRTIENRRAMVRSTCSGYTVYFDRAGRIVSEAEGYYIESYLNADVPIFKKSYTFYTRFGDWFPFLAAILIPILLLFNRIRSLYLKKR